MDYMGCSPKTQKGCSHHTEYAARSQAAGVGIYGDSTTCRRATDFEEV